MSGLKTGALKPIRILVVDDDDVDRERVVRCLRSYPAAIALKEAASLAEALAAVAGAPFDLIIIDGFLGDGEGIDIVAHLGGRRNVCPVILVTGFSTERDAVDAIRVGVYDYIPKHQLSSQLLSRVISNGLQWSIAQAAMLEAERALRHRGLYDTLTELPNRNLFMDRLEQACATTARYGTPFAVMMMDLDRFKHVNDGLGHAVGDQVLQQVGKRLAAAFRQSDTVARLAGDEFAAICQCVDSLEIAAIVAEKILAAVKLPVIVGGHVLSVGISIGIALCPAHGTKADYLLSVADKGMYQAKAGLKKVFCMESIASTKQPLPQAVLSDVEQGMKNREFVLYYQPKIDLATHRTMGVEALMRWRRDGSLVAPDDFIPVIEHSALLSEFTFMSIDLALEQMADWQRRGLALNVAVNISSRMLEDTGLAQQLRRRLERQAIPPELLTLEITETAIIANPEAARKVARQITDIGIRLSIDDFGAGFTSFTYLQEFSIAEIKIDKQFIMKLQPVSFGASLVRCISAFCASEGIRVVAEGVEHKQTWPVLCDLGCNIGQGYSIARPAAAAGLEAWLGTAVPYTNRPNV